MKFSRTGLLTAILVVAALFIGSYISQALPVSDRVIGERPFMHEASLGDTVRLRTADVTVTAVQTAFEVESKSTGQVASTSGVWIVFDITWSPVGESALLENQAAVVRAADGREFGGSQAVTSNCGPTQPGLPVACQLPIEISADALEGAHLLLPAGGYINLSDDVADYDLGIDAELASELADADERIVLLESTTELP